MSYFLFYCKSTYLSELTRWSEATIFQEFIRNENDTNLYSRGPLRGRDI